MDFEKAVSLVSTVTDLRRIASAHVIDHNQLKDEELRAALVRSKAQYTAAETVQSALDELLSREPTLAAAAENTRQHGHALLGEGVGKILKVCSASALWWLDSVFFSSFIAFRVRLLHASAGT
jgi:hypothetical protein